MIFHDFSIFFATKVVNFRINIQIEFFSQFYLHNMNFMKIRKSTFLNFLYKNSNVFFLRIFDYFCWKVVNFSSKSWILLKIRKSTFLNFCAKIRMIFTNFFKTICNKNSQFWDKTQID